MSTPASKAADLVDLIEREVLAEAWAELDVDPSADSLIVYFVSVKDLSPSRPFGDAAGGTGARALRTREWVEAVEQVTDALRRGDPPKSVATRLRRMQRWEWGAIALNSETLEAELMSRYELSEAEPETELDWTRIPGGILIKCQVLLRARDV